MSICVWVGWGRSGILKAYRREAPGPWPKLEMAGELAMGERLYARL